MSTLNDLLRMGEECERRGRPHDAADMYRRAAETLLYKASRSTGAERYALVQQADVLSDKVDALEGRSPSSAEVTAETHPAQRITASPPNVPSAWPAEPIPDQTFDDVAGLKEVKRIVLERVLLPMRQPELFRQMDLRPGIGMLMFGPPGTGKTTIARAIAGELRAHFFLVSCSDILSKWLGEAEDKIHALFESARACSSAVIFFDDFEGLAQERDSAQNDAIARIVTQLLVEIDGFRQNSGSLLLLAATNRPWQVDSALLRSGRFSESVYIPLPDAETRETLLRLQVKKAHVADALPFATYVANSDGYNGADIVALCDRAKMNAIWRAFDARQNEALLNDADFVAAFAHSRPTVRQDDLTKLREYMEKINYPLPSTM